MFLVGLYSKYFTFYQGISMPEKNLNTTQQTDTVVIIPTYNEKENIEAIIRAVFDLEKDFAILVVDDNSPDGTAAIVNQLHPEFPNRLFIENRKEKQGLGVAYIHGFRWALKAGFGYIMLKPA